MPANSVMAVLICLKGSAQLPPSQDFLFQPVLKRLSLSQQEGPRAHIVDTRFLFVEVQNITNRPVTILRKVCLGNIFDFKEKRCYATSANKTHLVAGAKWPKQRIKVAIDNFNQVNNTAKHPIRFTAYRMQAVRDKLFATASKYNIWAKTSGFIDVLKSKWMPIRLKSRMQSTGAKVYQLGLIDRKLIDKTFDSLHKRGKMEWSKNPTQYKALVFVIWRTLPSGEKKPSSHRYSRTK